MNDSGSFDCKGITNVNFSKLPYFIKIWQRKSLPTLVGWG